MDSLGPIQLPKIGGAQGVGGTSPFKGFLDISVVSQKMRKGMATQGVRNRQGFNSVKGGAGMSCNGNPFKP
jgi:hypothetical protein